MDQLNTMKTPSANYSLEDVPSLVEKINGLEKDVEEYKSWNDHLQSKLKTRVLEKKGKKEQAAWEVRLDEKNNRVYLSLEGRFNYPIARTACMNIMSVLSHSRRGFDIIVDISSLYPSLERRAIFHVKKMLYNMRYLGLRRAVLIRNTKARQVAEIFESQVKAVYGDMAMIPIFDAVADADGFLNR